MRTNLEELKKIKFSESVKTFIINTVNPNLKTVCFNIKTINPKSYELSLESIKENLEVFGAFNNYEVIYCLLNSNIDNIVTGIKNYVEVLTLFLNKNKKKLYSQ